MKLGFLLLFAALIGAISPGARAETLKTHDQRILIVVTSHRELGDTGRFTGYQLNEVTEAYYTFMEAGLRVDFASPKGGRTFFDPVSEDRGNPYNQRFFGDLELQSMLSNTLPLDSVSASNYIALYLPGGHGTMWDFPGSKPLARITAEIYENDGVISGVCHGPAGLVNVRLSSGEYLVAGKALTSFTNQEEGDEHVNMTEVVPFLLEDALVQRGGLFKAAPPFSTNIVTSDRLVTGQNPASALGVAREVVRLLE